MERTLIKDLNNKTGQDVTISGWVDIRRDHGKLVFLDMRDRSGKVQVVGGDNLKEVRPEWVLEISGAVKKRPEKMVNEKSQNGSIEIEASDIRVLNECVAIPIDISKEGYEIREEHRLKYRYLDLRRERLQKNIRTRYEIIKLARQFLDQEGFLEIETPILTKSTPEGARDYVVSSRLYPGTFYALPQSPQQYKQLLMTAGFEKYFQIARCFRDEDTRGDRQPEFTQLDLEMSFVEKEDVMRLTEELLLRIITSLFPEKKIATTPFPRMDYKTALEKYGTDRPDLRASKDDPDLLAFVWVENFPFFARAEEGGYTFTHNPFSRPIAEHEEWLMKKENIENIITSQYDIVLNGFEIAGGSLRNHKAQALEKVFEIIGYAKESIQENFGHMLEALSYGTPPHGGIAWGLDRLVSILLNEPNIREVIAFPKTGEGRDLMMQAPAAIEDRQLKVPDQRA